MTSPGALSAPPTFALVSPTPRAAPGTEEKMSGYVEKVFTAGPRFTAGLFRCDDGRVVKFSGRLYTQPAGPVTIEGEWTDDPKYGLQFLVTTLSVGAELTPEGIGRYLSSLGVKGLGPATSEKIAKAFGARVGFALEHEPDAVASVSGLSMNEVKNLGKIWFANESRNATCTWLASCNLTAHQTSTLVDTFGDSIREILRDDPYRLIHALKGFGFKRVDEVALKTGTAPDDPSRVRAAVAHAVAQASEESGHTWVYREDLASMVSSLLGAHSVPDIEEHIDAAVEDDQVVIVQQDGHSLVALPQLYSREFDLVSIFSRPAARNPHFTNLDVETLLIEEGMIPSSSDDGMEEIGSDDEYLDDAPEESMEYLDGDEVGDQFALFRAAPATPAASMVAEQPKHLNADQLSAVKAAMAHSVSLISGGAGSGKTFTITALATIYESLGLVVALTAPTGRAAKRIEQVVGRPAQTMHRLLQANGRLFGHEQNGRRDENGEWTSRPFLVSADVIIVDEFSMVDIDLAWHFFQSVDLNRTAVVLVGDHNQLPPVGPGSILRDLVDRRPIPTTVLSQVMRQAGTLKENCLAVLKGQVRPTIPLVPAAPPVSDEASPPTTTEFSPWIVKDSFTDSKDAARFVLKLYRELLTERMGWDLLQDVQLLSPMRKGPLGTLELNRKIQIVIQKKLWGVDVKTAPDEEPPLLEHDRVIQTSNNYELGVMNGTIGVVTRVVPRTKTEPGSLVVRFDGGGTVTYPLSKTHQLSLAYALTIHKAQGAEFPCAISIVHQAHSIMHDRNLLYTAVTRAQKTALIVGSRFAMDRCAKSLETSRRNTFLAVLPMRNVGGGAGAAMPKRTKASATSFLFDDD